MGEGQKQLLNETKLSEQEVLLLEAYRRLEDKGRMEVWHTVMRAEEMQTVTKLWVKWKRLWMYCGRGS